MNRRIWIKQIMIAGGGVFLLPACMTDEGAVSIVLKNISLNGKEEMLLAEVTEAIIPLTNTPGAKALNLPHFVLKMMDDCYDKTQQKTIMAGLRQLNTFSEKSTGTIFTELAHEKKLSLFREIADGKSLNEDLKFFLAETRRWVIKGFDNSEYFMTQLVPYELVPGHFKGCVTINKSI